MAQKNLHGGILKTKTCLVADAANRLFIDALPENQVR